MLRDSSETNQTSFSGRAINRRTLVPAVPHNANVERGSCSNCSHFESGSGHCTEPLRIGFTAKEGPARRLWVKTGGSLWQAHHSLGEPSLLCARSVVVVRGHPITADTWRAAGVLVASVCRSRRFERLRTRGSANVAVPEPTQGYLSVTSRNLVSTPATARPRVRRIPPVLTGTSTCVGTLATVGGSDDSTSPAGTGTVAASVRVAPDGGVSRQRSSVLGPAARPIALPDRLEAPTVSGEVLLPLNVCWSGRRRFDLNDRSDRARVYEQVLREGTSDDIERYVDADLLVDLWEELVLPPPVAEAWAAWLRRHGYLDPGC